MCGNLLVSLDPGTFQDTVNLIQLDLSRNMLENLDPYIFKGWILKLIFIFILKSEQFSLLKGLINLQKVFMHGNQLGTGKLELYLEKSVTYLAYKRSYNENDVRSITNLRT
jgi:hypothetical protein